KADPGASRRQLTFGAPAGRGGHRGPRASPGRGGPEPPPPLGGIRLVGAPRPSQGATHRMNQAQIPVDVDVLRGEIGKTYTDVSTESGEEFIFPTGRWWAAELGYPEPALSRIPDETVASFAGVANHWLLGRIEPGSVVLDLGCGAGTDLLIAAQMT